MTGTDGRPEKEFHTSSVRSRRRKIHNLKTSPTTAAAQLVTKISTTGPSRAKRILSKWRRSKRIQTEMAVEEALYLIISSELAKSQYRSLRMAALGHGQELYPRYCTIVKAKMVAYPDGIKIT